MSGDYGEDFEWGVMSASKGYVYVLPKDSARSASLYYGDLTLVQLIDGEWSIYD